MCVCVRLCVRDWVVCLNVFNELFACHDVVSVSDRSVCELVVSGSTVCDSAVRNSLYLRRLYVRELCVTELYVTKFDRVVCDKVVCDCAPGVFVCVCACSSVCVCVSDKQAAVGGRRQTGVGQKK